MSGEEIELNDLDNIRNIEEEGENKETDFGGASNENDLLDSLDWLSNRGKNANDKLNKLFGNRVYQARNIGFFIEDLPLLEREKGYTDPRFIEYLMETQEFEIEKTLSVSLVLTNYKVSYYGAPFVNDEGIRIRPVRNFKTTNGVISEPEDLNQIIDDIRYHYDNWRKIELDKILKRWGIATAIGLSIIALVTGLSLGLKRSGSDIIRDAKQKARKLTPAEKRDVIPWTDIQEASGKGVIFIGDHLYLIIGGSIICLYSVSKKTKR